MARLQIAGRKAVPSGGPSATQISSSAGSDVSQQYSRFGSTLQALGGKLADIAMAVKRSQIRQEIFKAQNDYESGMDEFLLEQEKNPNLSAWGDDTRAKHEELLSSISTREMTGKARDEFTLWAKDRENKIYFQVASKSAKLIAENERNSLQLSMEQAAKHGRKQDFVEQLDNMVEDNMLHPSEREAWLDKFDEQTDINNVLQFIEFGVFDDAKQYIKTIDDPELRRTLRTAVKGAEAAEERQKAAELKELRERSYADLLGGIWDEAITDPGIVEDALSSGYITVEAAKYLRDAVLNPAPRVTSNAATIAVQYAIRGIKGNERTIEDALEVVAKYADEISATDGKQFIKDVFAAGEDKENARWEKESWDYIEKQIMNVDSLTGIVYGTGEQMALAAQAHIAFDSTVKRAIKAGKPIMGRELLILAHDIVLPYRKRIKPLIGRAGTGKEDTSGVPGTLREPGISSRPEEDLINNPEKYKGRNEPTVVTPEQFKKLSPEQQRQLLEIYRNLRETKQ